MDIQESEEDVAQSSPQAAEENGTAARTEENQPPGISGPTTLRQPMKEGTALTLFYPLPQSLLCPECTHWPAQAADVSARKASLLRPLQELHKLTSLLSSSFLFRTTHPLS